jgi:hypothetical protein
MRTRISRAVFRRGLTGNGTSEQSDSKLDSAEIVAEEIKAFAQFYCINAGTRKKRAAQDEPGMR